MSFRYRIVGFSLLLLVLLVSIVSATQSNPKVVWLLAPTNSLANGTNTGTWASTLSTIGYNLTTLSGTYQWGTTGNGNRIVLDNGAIGTTGTTNTSVAQIIPIAFTANFSVASAVTEQRMFSLGQVGASTDETVRIESLSDQTLLFRIKAGGTSCDVNVGRRDDGAHRRYVWMKNGANITVFINGSQAGYVNCAQSIGTDWTEVTIGQMNNGGSPTNGAIWDICMDDVAWNNAEIQSDYTSPCGISVGGGASGPPQIIQTSYNVTSGLYATGPNNKTVFQNYTNLCVNVTDTTPSISFSLTATGNTSISRYNQNYSTQMSNTSGLSGCATLSTTNHLCTLSNSLKFESAGSFNLYAATVSSQNEQNATSTSPALCFNVERQIAHLNFTINGSTNGFTTTTGSSVFVNASVFSADSTANISVFKNGVKLSNLSTSYSETLHLSDAGVYNFSISYVNDPYFHNFSASIPITVVESGAGAQSAPVTASLAGATEPLGQSSERFIKYLAVFVVIGGLVALFTRR